MAVVVGGACAFVVDEVAAGGKGEMRAGGRAQVKSGCWEGEGGGPWLGLRGRLGERPSEGEVTQDCVSLGGGGGSSVGVMSDDMIWLERVCGSDNWRIPRLGVEAAGNTLHNKLWCEGNHSSIH